MKVKKMLLLAGMSLAAIAFAAPAAQADLSLTNEGKILGVGAKVTVTSTNLQTKTAAGTLTCKLVTLHYQISKANSKVVDLEPVPNSPTDPDNATTEECHVETGGVGGPTDVVHISSAGTKAFSINTWGTGVAESTFTALITGPPKTTHCTFTGKVHVQATDKTDIVHIGPSPLAGPCGAGTIEGSGTLETPNGTPIVAHFKPTP